MREIYNLTFVGGTNGHDKAIMYHTGLYRVPLYQKDNVVILDVVFFRQETRGLAILARDEEGNLKDFIFHPKGRYFIDLTEFGEMVDWRRHGFTCSPGIAHSLIINKFIISKESKMENSEKSTEYAEIGQMVAEIAEREPEAAKAIEMVVRHIRGTYNDKYAKGQDVIDTKRMLYDKERGDFLNIYQVSRYLQRYLTQGSAKSHLIKDVEKAIHYLVFELTRRIRLGDVDETEPKV